MKLQIIHDSKGKATGVYIPINEWDILKKKYHDLEMLEKLETSREQILIDIKEAIHELALVEKGQMKARPIKELLNEL
ncbi:TPA: hypothetical protein ACGZ96_003550 [Elizabethkingia anophelis]|uniref:hypothetical protein n=1 Tax=Elizabethkingia anophelis TaxID=1117645 RepID=UPI00320A5A15